MSSTCCSSVMFGGEGVWIRDLAEPSNPGVLESSMGKQSWC